MDFEQVGVLKGHNGWVTSIAISRDGERIVTASRDKTLISWRLEDNPDRTVSGVPVRSLEGHSHFVEDVALSFDGQFALSASWDKSLRLWDLNTGACTTKFLGHTKDVLAVSFSQDNRQIVSCSRDKTVKLWNTVGECKHTFEGHMDWVNDVKFSPGSEPQICSAGSDELVKVWDAPSMKLHLDLHGHTGIVNALAISPDGSLCASGGKDGVAILWDIKDGKTLCKLDANSEILALEFSPNRYWLCAATTDGVKLFDLESKKVIATLQAASDVAAQKGYPISMAWSHDGFILFAGHTDHNVYLWKLVEVGDAVDYAGEGDYEEEDYVEEPEPVE
uniref:Guanine nucleotide-binding protein subunit beta-like protein A n=1 Tax=Stygiella incarcerata TaxID=1712417 RepID=A0A192ZI91_9EUKA|nr:guanine nucleotide-binding protein subunit beta-like protein A [Stygiella incarcerata]|eukprot:TRINITY_DN82749_c0_g1_i1.p1 TRINITY_DN82749_c0_g1~~TRINITY_DN82749_c0_g1_i1.p1  ORF type:complete len:334 (+),score=79.78 TRINITY_DN82749_c0_g1_i1:124-1125(+)